MQTFLPHRDFWVSAHQIDPLRLGKQRLEARQLMTSITRGVSRGWANHPAAKMWVKWPHALRDYGLRVCERWIELGYEDKSYEWFRDLDLGIEMPTPEAPPWLGDALFHLTHQSNLLRKDPSFYRQFEWKVPPNLEYVWPVPLEPEENKSGYGLRITDPGRRRIRGGTYLDPFEWAYRNGIEHGTEIRP